MDHKRHREDSENRSRKQHKKHSSRRHDSGREGEVERRHQKHSRHRHRDARYDPHMVIKQEREDRNLEQQQLERSHHDERRREHRRERDRRGGDHGLNTQSAPVKQEPGVEEPAEEEEEEKQKPNFELSGKLTEDTNTFRGVVIKYNEPPEAMKPKRKWRLYPFKGSESLPILHIHRQSAFLLGRERKIADIPVDHPSCSKQHAVLQFRAVPYDRPDGTTGRRVRPYVIDLESANGTLLNGDRIEPKRYYELKEKDVIKFGFSSREYVLLHDKVDTSGLADSGDDD